MKFVAPKGFVLRCLITPKNGQKPFIGEYYSHTEDYETTALKSIAEELASKIFWKRYFDLKKDPTQIYSIIDKNFIYDILSNFETRQSFMNETMDTKTGEMVSTWRSCKFTDLNQEQKDFVMSLVYEILEKQSLTCIKKYIDEEQQKILDSRTLLDLNQHCQDCLQDLAAEIKSKVGQLFNNKTRSFCNSCFSPKLRENTPDEDVESVRNIISTNLLEKFKKQLSRNDYIQLKILLSKFKVVDDLIKITEEQSPPAERLQKFERHVLDNFYLLKKNEDSGFNFISKVIKTIKSFGRRFDKLWNNRGDQFVRDVTTFFHPKKEKEQGKRVQSTIPINPNAIRIIQDLENESPTSSSLRS